MIFDGVLAATGDDDDVLDARGNALFRDVLNLRLVDNRQHFLGLRFRGGQKRVPSPAAEVPPYAPAATEWKRSSTKMTKHSVS